MADTAERAKISDDEYVERILAMQPELRSLLVGLVPYLGDAEDMLQEVNMALWRKRDLYDARQEFARWVFGFVSMEVRSFRTRRARNRLYYSDEAIELLASDWPNKASYVDDCRQALANCMQRLGGLEREVITARYTRQLSVNEIAEKTGKPSSTIYRVMRRAREALRVCITRTHMAQHSTRES